jgi:hypothetical protein
MPKLNAWRVYLNPFDDQGVYSGWVEITKDVVFDQLGSISENLDNTEFDVGIFRNATVDFVVRNDGGKYSDVDNPHSIFRFRRTGTQMKITWEVDPDCDVEVADIANSWVSEEVEVFKGILNDDGASQDLETSQITFAVLGRETLLDNDSVPFTLLANGNLFSAALYTVLNRPILTALVTVSAINITCGTDQAIDDVSSFEGMTLLEATQTLLAASNSVMRIVEDVLYISPRTPTVAVQETFYGQASSSGAETIQTIRNIRSGIAKTFNYGVWTDTTIVVEDATSVAQNGVRKKEVSFDFITDQTKREAILQSLVDEFLNPKQEFEIVAPVSYSNILLRLLDRVSVDYPTIHLPWDHDLPICGNAVWGTWWTPPALWNFQVASDDHYKIMSRTLDTKNGLVRFGLRAA